MFKGLLLHIKNSSDGAENFGVGAASSTTFRKRLTSCLHLGRGGGIDLGGVVSYAAPGSI